MDARLGDCLIGYFFSRRTTHWRFTVIFSYVNSKKIEHDEIVFAKIWASGISLLLVAALTATTGLLPFVPVEQSQAQLSIPVYPSQDNPAN